MAILVNDVYNSYSFNVNKNTNVVFIRIEYEQVQDGVVGENIDQPYCSASWVNLQLRGGQQTSTSLTEEYMITINQNEGKTRNTTIQLGYTDDFGTEWAAQVYITQGGEVKIGMEPIWKDVYFVYNDYYSESTDNSVEYSIKDGDKVIYKGKIYRNPADQSMTANISRICQDYITDTIEGGEIHGLIEGGDFVEHTNAFKTFTLVIGDDTYAFPFYYNWDYKQDYIDITDDYTMLNEPINGHFAAGMPLFFTAFVPADDRMSIPTEEKGQGGDTIEVRTGYTTFCLNPEDDIEVGGVKYTKKGCSTKCLYYLNSHGGFDSFLIEGRIKKTDEYDTKTYEKSYDNNSPCNFAKREYYNQITTKYEISTGWLDDEQADRLCRNLLSSPEVYLYDFTEGVYEPTAVIITNTEAEYKKYKDSHEMIKYTLNLEESQKRQRL